MPVIAQFNQDRYAATSAVRCIQVYIPDDDSYMPLLAGLLALPGDATNYQEPDSAQAEGVAAVWLDAYILTDWEGCTMPDEWGFQDRFFLGGAFVENNAGNAVISGFFTNAGLVYFQNPASAGNEGRYRNIRLRAGRYVMKWQTGRSNAVAIVDVFMSGNLNSFYVWEDLDLYFNSGFFLDVFVSAEFEVPEDDEFTLIFDIPGKNPASSNFNVYYSGIEIRRTGDL